MTASREFSLLLPVYGGDDPAYFRRAFDSATVEQEVAPSEVIIVQDGPVGPVLAAVLDEIRASYPGELQLLDLPVNVGLARALQKGLDAASNDVIARMDADDICSPDRFARQLPLVASGFDIVGSAIREFEIEGGPGIVRTPPLTPARIDVGARFHSPFNHPSVVFRREAVVAAGGYQDLPLLEDYWLFARMLAEGSRGCNIDEPLLHYRVGAGAYARRGGVRLLRSEFELQRRMRQIGFTTRSQMMRNVLVRCGYRMIPESVRRVAYRAILTDRARRG